MLSDTDLAAVAAALSILAYLPYGWAVLTGAAQPQRASWLIWTVLSSTALFAMLSAGATRGILFTGAQATGTAVIFALALWRGTGALWSATEAVVLGLAALGLGLWWMTQDPAWALGLSIGIGALGGMLTVAKAWRMPASEAMVPWALQTLAALFGVASVLGGTAMEMAYPFYLLGLYAAILGAAAFGQVRLAPSG